MSKFWLSHEFWLLALSLGGQVVNKVFGLGFSTEEVYQWFGLSGSYILGRQFYKAQSGKTDGNGDRE